MPAIARKILICAAIDGLIIQPLSSKGQRPFQPVRIKYGDATVSHVAREHVPDASNSDSSFEAFGVIGMLIMTPRAYSPRWVYDMADINCPFQVSSLCPS